MINTMVSLRHRTVEAPPERHRAPSWPRRSGADDAISFADIRRMPEPDWIGRSQNGGFALDADLLEPLEQADWSARIAADWEDVNAQFAKATFRAAAALIAVERTYVLAVCMLTAPFIAGCEAFEAELAPLTAKAGADDAEAKYLAGMTTELPAAEVDTEAHLDAVAAIWFDVMTDDDSEAGR